MSKRVRDVPVWINGKETTVPVVEPWTTNITFLNRVDTYKFKLGMPLFQRKPYTGFGRFWAWLTAPFRKRVVVLQVDYNTGCMTIGNQPKWYRFLREG